MADTLDTLQIQLESNAGDAYKGLDSFAASLEKVSGAFGKIDVSRVNNMATAFDNFGKSIERLANATNSLDLSKLSGNFNNLDSIINNEVTKSLEQFGITGKKQISDVVLAVNALRKNLSGRSGNISGDQFIDTSALGDATDAVDIFSQMEANASSETKAFNNALSSATDIIRQNAKDVRSGVSGYEDLLELMKLMNAPGGSKIYVPKEEVETLTTLVSGADWSQIRAVLGGNFTSQRTNYDAAEFLRELNTVLPATTDSAKSAGAQLAELFNILKTARGGTLKGDDALASLGFSQKDIENSLVGVAEKVNEAEAKISQEGGGTNGFVGLRASVNEVTQAVRDKTQAFVDEGKTVSQVVSSERSGLDSLRRAVTTVSNAYSNLGKGKDAKLGSGDNVSNISQAEGAVKGLITEMQQFSGVQFDLSGINELFTTLSKFGYKSISNAVMNIPFLQQAISGLVSTMNGLQGVTFDTAGLSDLIKAISSLGNKKIGSAVTSLPALTQGLSDLVNSLNGLQGINFDASGLAQLADILRVLGSKTAQTAISGLDQLGDAMKRLMTTLSSAPAVSQNLIQMTQALAQLAAQGNRVGSATNALTPTFPRMNLGMRGARQHAFSLASAFGRLYASYWLILRAIRGVKGWVDLASSLTEIQNVVDHTFGNMQGVLNDFTQDSIQKFGMSELSAKQAATRYQSMGVAMGLTGGMVKRANDNLSGLGKTVYNTNGSLADMSVNLTKLVADYASFYDMDQKEVAEKFDAVFTGQTRPLRSYGIDLTQATLKEWAMRNGLNANIQAMSQAEKTMLRYQYVMANSQHIMGDFARTSDKYMCRAA